MGELAFLWVASAPYPGRTLTRCKRCFAPFDDPDDQATRWFYASREVQERESNPRSRITLYASKGDLRCFNQGNVFSHISCFSHNPRKLFMEFAFCAFHLEGVKGGRRFGGLPRISPWASICGEVLLILTTELISFSWSLLSGCRSRLSMGWKLGGLHFPCWPSRVMPVAAACGRIDALWVILR
jgi:hypothetical protein